jgi:hypothetical protein
MPGAVGDADGEAGGHAGMDPGVDLAANPPGRSAQRRADDLRRAHPVWSLVAPFLGVRTEDRDWDSGAAGERRVGRWLGRLPAGWHVVHAVPVGRRGADIDHVVVGRPGVFTINTKHHPEATVWVGDRRILVDGRPTAYLDASLTEAARARRLLSSACGFDVPVVPVVAVLARRLVMRGRPQGVEVVRGQMLAGWLCRRPPRLPVAAVERVYDVARRAATWR